MNLLDYTEPSSGEELVTELVRSNGVRIERIVSLNYRSTEEFWYDQPEDEWVLVIGGYGVILFEDGNLVRLLPGHCLHIPANARHRVEATDPDEPTVWLAVHFDPR